MIYIGVSNKDMINMVEEKFRVEAERLLQYVIKAEEEIEFPEDINRLKRGLENIIKVLDEGNLPKNQADRLSAVAIVIENKLFTVGEHNAE